MVESHDDREAEIFISYKRERRRAAEHLANVFECHAYHAWYDYNLIPGHDFRPQLEARIDAACVVVVLWCTKSVQSDWVLREACRAHERKNLLPVLIEPCVIPEDYRYVHTLNLSDWDGSPRSADLDPLWVEIERRTGRINPLLQSIRKYERTWLLFDAPKLRAFTLERGPTDHRAEQPNRSADKLFSPSAAKPESIGSAIYPNADNQASHEVAATVVAERHEKATVWWTVARDSEDVRTLQNFIDSFGDTLQAQQAREMIAQIERRTGAIDRSHSALPLVAADVEQLRREGRISIPVKAAHGVIQDRGVGWFLPGGGLSEWFQDHVYGPQMVVVPAGEFDAGLPGKTQRSAILRPFAISRTVVTFEHWDGALKLSAFVDHHADDLMWGRAGHPAIHVSFVDAAAYCRWLSRVTGRSYRLPTEVEWELACRAGSMSDYWTGATITRDQANFDARQPDQANPVVQRGTRPVRSYPANPWGLYETHGNVWEWVDEPLLGHTLEHQTVKGGSWTSSAAALRSGASQHALCDIRDYNIGFRVVRTL